MAEPKPRACEELRDAHQIPVSRLEIALVVPILIQAKKCDDRSFVDPGCDPDSKHDFLDRWVRRITEEKDASRGDPVWKEIKGGYPPLKGEDAEPAYSEFCYMHPFVRNFLYVTRGDMRAYEKAQEKTFRNENRDPPWGDVARQDLITESPNRNLRILERQGLKELQIEYEMDVDGQGHYRRLRSEFTITSCWLYLFDTQVAMLGLRLEHVRTGLVVEGEEPSGNTAAAAAAAGLNLRQVLKIQDIVRRLYSPYWDTFSPPDKPTEVWHHDSHVPQRMKLVFDKPANGVEREPVKSSFGNFKTQATTVTRLKQADFSGIADASEDAAAAENHLRHVFFDREPYTVEVWRELLWPLLPTAYQPGAKTSFPLCFEHIQDDRAMLMSHIAVSEPACDIPAELAPKAGPRAVRRIKPGDWLRLATVDDPGDSDRYPYSPAFFPDAEHPLADFAYDRFWHPTGDAPGQDRGQTTRWLCCGYGFTAVGDAASGFFSDAHSGALCHFRHHYFALAMIAQFHRSSLLHYKHRLAEAADAMLTGEETNERLRQIEFREKVELLVKEMMRFRTLYWFIEVSNQIQGRELFDRFRRHLNLQQLFENVYGDAEAAVGLLRQWDADDETRASQSLAVLGAVFLVLGPLISYLDNVPKEGSLSAYVSAAVALAGLTMLFVRIPSAWLVPGHSRSGRFFSRKCRDLVRWPIDRRRIVCGALIAAGLIGVVLSWWLRSAVVCGTLMAFGVMWAVTSQWLRSAVVRGVTIGGGLLAVGLSCWQGSAVCGPLIAGGVIGAGLGWWLGRARPAASRAPGPPQTGCNLWAANDVATLSQRAAEEGGGGHTPNK